ncbi:MAG: hypothetical protein FJX03_04145 [Alphaproteobacteria bacterium]|nr:hypothetical protein [Alphaproteobacteria bacterium]
MDDKMSWLLSSRGWTKDLALGLLTSLFKVHSLGIGGFTAYLAATKNHHLQSDCKTMIFLTYYYLALGLGSILWSWKNAYEGQDYFSLDPDSENGKISLINAKIWAFCSFFSYIFATIIFGIFITLPSKF